MEKEDSVTTPAQSGRKRKPVRAPKPERKKKSVKLQNSLAISVRMEQEKVDEEIDDEIRKQRINVHELDDEDVEEIDDERINVHEHVTIQLYIKLTSKDIEPLYMIMRMQRPSLLENVIIQLYI